MERRAGRVLQTTGAPIERVAYYLSIGGRELEPALLRGQAHPGDLVALVGFGAGLCWGGQLLVL